MKNLFLGFVATVVFCMSTNAQIKVKANISIDIPIKIVFGTPTYKDRQIFCLGNGICSISMGSGNITADNFSISKTGDLYLKLPKKENEWVKNGFTLKETPTIDSKTLVAVNNELIKINPNAKKFTAIQKDYYLKPIEEEEFYYILVN